jgi:uncharacterized protein
MKLGRALCSLPRLAVISLVRIYQRTLSRVLPPTCRFEPSCSAYMIESVEMHGVLRGVLLGLWRIVRCNPFCRGGYDPVPPARGRDCDPGKPAHPEP